MMFLAERFYGRKILSAPIFLSLNFFVKFLFDRSLLIANERESGNPASEFGYGIGRIMDGRIMIKA